MTATTLVDETVGQFGHQLGFDNLTFDELGRVWLVFEYLGELLLELREDSVIVCLTREIHHADVRIYRRALELCEYDQNDQDWLQAVVLKEGHLTFATRIPHEQFELSEIEAALVVLGNLHDRLADLL